MPVDQGVLREDERSYLFLNLEDDQKRIPVMRGQIFDALYKQRKGMLTYQIAELVKASHSFTKLILTDAKVEGELIEIKNLDPMRLNYDPKPYMDSTWRLSPDKWVAMELGEQDGVHSDETQDGSSSGERGNQDHGGHGGKYVAMARFLKPESREGAREDQGVATEGLRAAEGEHKGDDGE